MEKYVFEIELETARKLTADELIEMRQNILYRCNGYSIEPPTFFKQTNVEMSIKFSKDTLEYISSEKV